MLSSRQFTVDIPCDVLSAPHRLPALTTGMVEMFEARLDLISTEFIAWLESRHLYPLSHFDAVLTYLPECAETRVYSSAGSHNSWALYVALEDADVEMRWHSPTQAIEEGPLRRFVHNRTFIQEHVQLTAVVGKSSHPHSFVNKGKPAWVLELCMEPNTLSWPFLFNRFCGDAPCN